MFGFPPNLRRELKAKNTTANHNMLTFDAGRSTSWYWDSTQPMMANAQDGFEYQRCGFLPAQKSATSTNMFEDDNVYTHISNNMFLYFGCSWYDSPSSDKLWCVYLSNARSRDDGSHSFSCLRLLIN